MIRTCLDVEVMTAIFSFYMKGDGSQYNFFEERCEHMLVGVGVQLYFGTAQHDVVILRIKMKMRSDY